MCKKNGNWELIPVEDIIYNKYNPKDGILGEILFDSIDGIDEEKIGMAKVVAIKGKEKTEYIIDYEISSLIRSIKIFETTVLIDKFGNELDTRYKFIGDNIISNFNSLCYDGIIEEDGVVVGSNIAITDNFRKKYPLFLDLFIHYSPLEYNPIGFDITKSRLENNMAYFTVTSFLECKEREYEVYYTLDKNNYLDDVDVKCVKEVELATNNKNSGTKAFYLNSNLENTNLSDEFKQYLKIHGSYNSDINDININVNPESERIEKGKYIRCYKMKNGDINSYLVEYDGTETQMIYNIVSTKLPYKNMSAEEVKELYLKGLENNK